MRTLLTKLLRNILISEILNCPEHMNADGIIVNVNTIHNEPNLVSIMI